jgi:hypothetical protein
MLCVEAAELCWCVPCVKSIITNTRVSAWYSSLFFLLSVQILIDIFCHGSGMALPFQFYCIRRSTRRNRNRCNLLDVVGCHFVWLYVSAQHALVSSGGRIPDAAMIHAARKRRQLAREMGSDYIPVENNSINKK